MSSVLHQASPHLAMCLGAHSLQPSETDCTLFNRYSTGNESCYIIYLTSSPRRIFRLFPICRYYQLGRDPIGFEDSGPNPTSLFILLNENKNQWHPPTPNFKRTLLKRSAFRKSIFNPFMAETDTRNTKPTITVRSPFSSTLLFTRLE